MRWHSLTLAGLLLAAAAPAQTPPSPPLPPAAPPAAATLNPADPLDSHLMKWEEKMKSVEKLAAAIRRTEKDKISGITKVLEGHAWYMKPNYAILQLSRQGRPTDYVEKFLCTGQFLYEYRFGEKRINVHQLPPNQGGNNLLSFLFGMKAQDAKDRYNLTLDKADEHYILISIVPMQEPDKREFRKARLVLYAKNYLPAQLWFEQTNGDETIWELPHIDTNAALQVLHFAAPQMPADWKTNVIRPEAKPAVIPTPGTKIRP
jgi:TIGR03009 family protein